MKHEIEIPFRADFSGHWILVKHQADENGEPIPGTAEHVAEFDNLITNTGLDMIGIQVNPSWCQVGTGSTPPANSDTSLQSRIASTSSIQSSTLSYNASPEYAQRITVWRFAAGVAAGNLTEIGVAGGSVSPLFSRALILDSGGTPTTITILSTEVLDATYVLRIQPPAADVTFNGVVIGAQTFNGVIVRPANVGNWQNILSTFFSSSLWGSGSVLAYDGNISNRSVQPVGNSASVSPVAGNYSNGSYTRQVTASWGLTEANFANGVKAFFSSIGPGYYQYSLNGANIPKTANDTLSVTFNLSWGRV